MKWRVTVVVLAGREVGAGYPNRLRSIRQESRPALAQLATDTDVRLR